METYSQAPASTEQSSLFELQVDHELSSTFGDMAKWAKFVGISGFVFTGLILLVTLFIGNAFATLSPFGSFAQAGGTAVVIIYIIMAALFFFPSLFVFNFSRKVQYALRNNDQASLNSSFAILKTRFKFVGILYIVIFSIWVIIYLAGLFR